jgi:hypothetical protein
MSAGRGLAQVMNDVAKQHFYCYDLKSLFSFAM